MKTVNKIELRSFFLRLESDEVVRAVVKDQAIVDLASAKEMTETLLEITPDGSRPLIVDLGKIKYITKEARDYFKSKNRKPSSPAVALIIRTQLSKIIGNFYLGLKQPLVPTRLFTDEKSALVWLEKYS